MAVASRPDADVPAGAQALPDRKFLKNSRSTCTFFIAPSGSNSNPGTQTQPWSTIGKALATLTAGQVACVQSGTYSDPGGATALNSGDEARPIVLMRAPGSPTRPVIALTQARPVLRIDRGYWLVDDLEFNLNDQYTTGIVFGPPAHHIALRNSYVHDDARGAAVYVAGDDISIEGGEIANNFQVDGSDSHGVNIVGGAARVLVKGVHIHDNGGDGVQCEYTGAAFDALTPVDITIQDNRFSTSPDNENRIEQGVDIKTCRNVSIRGSVPPDANDPAAASQKFLGFKDTSASARGASAMVIHLAARNVLVENNRIGHSCNGIGIGRHDAAYGIVENVVVRRNAFFNLKAVSGTACRGYGIMIQRVNHADVYHNTMDNLPGWAFQLGPNNQTSTKDADVDFWNNVVRNAQWFLDLNTSRIDGFASDHNLFWSSDGNQARFRIEGAAFTLAGWQGKQNGMSVLLADRASRVADPLFIAGAGTTDDYYTQSASPSRTGALDSTNAATYGSAPDFGFRETYDASGGAPCQTGTVDTAWPSETFPTQTGSFTALVDVTPLGAPIAAGVGLGPSPAQAWTGMAAIVRFDDVTGNIDARNGGTYAASSPIPYKANARYRIRFVVNLAVKTYAAYVTPPGGGEITIGTNLALRTEQQNATSLSAKTVATGIGSLLACNFRLTGGGAISQSG